MDKRFFVAETPCKRLDTFLSEQTDGYTRSRLKKLVEEGNVLVNGEKVVKAGADIKSGDRVELTVPEAAEYAVKPENIPIEIVYEDADLAVVNKPKGMTVHIGNGNENGTLVNALLYALDSLSGIGGVLRPGIVHRIDKDTTGLLVVAKNDKAHVFFGGADRRKDLQTYVLRSARRQPQRGERSDRDGYRSPPDGQTENGGTARRAGEKSGHRLSGGRAFRNGIHPLQIYPANGQNASDPRTRETYRTPRCGRSRVRI